MTNGTDRLGRLKRLQRLRDIDRRRAIEQAATAQQTFRQLAGLARRADELADAYAKRWESGDAAAIQDLRVFHSSLASLAQSTMIERDQAHANADIHDRAAGIANRKRDSVTERIARARKDIGKQRIMRFQNDTPQLARSLNKRES